MAVKDKKARFNPFVLPSDFFKSDGDPVYQSLTHSLKTSPIKLSWAANNGILAKTTVPTLLMAKFPAKVLINTATAKKRPIVLPFVDTMQRI